MKYIFIFTIIKKKYEYFQFFFIIIFKKTEFNNIN